MAAPAPSSAGLSPCASFVEESLILPGRNPRLFLPVVALVFAHTFVFLSLAVRSLHPAAAALLSLIATDAPPSSWSLHVFLEDDDYPEATGDKVLYHGKTLLLFYLAYLGSKLATQVAVALAASATARFPGRPLEVVVRGPRRLLATAAFLAAELASTALLAACVAAWWWACSGNGAVASFVSGVLLFPLLLAALARLCLAAAVPVAIAAAASSSEPVGGPSALRRAWRLISLRERRNEAAVLVGAASLLPLVVYPVYAFALACAPGDSVWELLGMLPGYLFPSVAVQLYSTVAAAVFYHRLGHHEPAAIPLTATKVIAS